MKRFLTLVLLLNLVVNGLFAQTKEGPIINSSFTFMPGYALTSRGTTIPFYVEYQIRHKSVGIGVGLFAEYQRYKYSRDMRQLLYEIGDNVYRWGDTRRFAYQSDEKWFNLAPSLVGYYYLRRKNKLEGFFRTGIVANYNAWYAYKGLEYKTDYRGQLLEKGLVDVGQTINSIDLQSINWLIGGGIQYHMNNQMILRLTSDIQWGRGILLLGGVSFKI